MNDILLKACRLEETERRPVWFLRQAGRYLPQYWKLKKGKRLQELFKDVEAAAQLTALPVIELGVDAAIVFADILTPLEGLGMYIDYEQQSPYVYHSMTLSSVIKALENFDPSSIHYVYDTIRSARSILSDSVPVIGFTGAPYTIGVYTLWSRSKDSTAVKALMHNGDEWFSFMDSMVCFLSSYVRCQVEAGARAIVIFDTLAYTLSREQFEKWMVSHTRALILEIRKLNVPVIYYLRNPSHLLKSIKRLSANVVGVDWTVDIATAWDELGTGVGIQGNLDPSAPLAGLEHAVRESVKILLSTRGRKGHIFSLGHGIHPSTSTEVLKRLVEMVKRWGC
ncbi:MAG: uroporphyrinogen decarboxylase [Candidatus Caldarchaeum sp.]